ncbi:hypothetical protein ACIBJF_40095 [Streptomyces sp. NPDC050743]|uniref:hypothetical protein n=1 Tax=Streptomyces sp. NPDC050743 TaxID=3365634 RepID=UPI0037A71EA9
MRPASVFANCPGPAYQQWDSYHGEPKPVPCPECNAGAAVESTCTATMLHALWGRVPRGRLAGHYDETLQPVRTEDPDLADPGGWHQSKPNKQGAQFVWCDTADGAVPHGPRCPTCGPTSLEAHPRIPGILRCSNCTEHLG